MPLPFIIGGIGAALSAVGGAAAATVATVGTAAATVGTAAAATAATVGTAAVGAATSTAGMAAIGAGTVGVVATQTKKKIEDAQYDAYKRGVRAGEHGLEEVKEAHAKEMEAKDAEIGYKDDVIEKQDDYIQAQDAYIDGKKSIAQRMSELHELYNMDLISLAEFEQKKMQILSEI